MMRLALAAMLLVAAPVLAADNKLHGALDMDEQQKRLDELLGERDPTLAPPGIDPVIWRAMLPKDNVVTAERVALGRKLYFDTRLSKDGTVACATCHDVSRGFTDQRPLSEGIGDQMTRRNSPTTLNALVFQTFFLDGRAPSLEEQAKLPITNPVEMGMPDGDATVAAIANDAEYKKMFQQAYGRKPNFDDLARAIAPFERTLVFLDSPLDRFLAGDESAISAKAKEGWVLYNGKARCVTCHALNRSSPIGTDDKFHNVGVSARKQNFEELADRALKTLAGAKGRAGMEAIDRLAIETDMSELGRFLVTKERADIGGFKTLQVRNVAITGPYMHDGSMQTLWDVMDHYNKGGEANAFLDGGIEPLALSESEIDALVELMFALTDRRFADEAQAQQTRQRATATRQRPFRDDALAMRRKLPFEDRVVDAGHPPGSARPPEGVQAVPEEKGRKQSGQEGRE